MVSCICSNKDKNFKANHNEISSVLILLAVVSVVTKIRILKQITTGRYYDAQAALLYL